MAASMIVGLVIGVVLGLLVGLLVGLRLQGGRGKGAAVTGHAPPGGTGTAAVAPLVPAPAPLDGPAAVVAPLGEPNLPAPAIEPAPPGAFGAFGAFGASEAPGAPGAPVEVAAAAVADAPVAAAVTQVEVEPLIGGVESGGHVRDVLDAVWQLQCLDLEIIRRREAGISTAVPDDRPVGLALAVQQEITRIREEIGTPGELRSDLGDLGDLAVEPDPASALLLLRSLESTLDFLARRSQAFDLHLSCTVQAVAVTVLCDDFEGDPDHDEPGAIAAAIAPAGGELRLDRDADGRMRAQLSVQLA